jgi:asparagine synthase (glutamine-hydrolysing)
MSILCGLLKDRGAFVEVAELRAIAASTRRYATADASSCIRSRIGMCLQPYFSHERSATEVQPRVDVLGNMVCFDGRLDNWSDLVGLLELKNPTTSDSHIVLAAFQKWGLDCLSRLTGDWALSFWSVESETLFLARDHAGMRTLYFSRTPEGLLWATHLDTFMLDQAEHPRSPEYACCYLSSLPIRDRTPYGDITSVLPGHVVTVREGTLSQSAHWSPFPKRSVRYAKTADYDQHFLDLFGKAVSRRTGPGAPVLAQLSGGMDSTAIVCMSDTLRRAADPHAEILDTLSFYDDSEPSLNEKAFFTITERYRSKTGTHIDAAFSQRSFRPYEGNKDRYLVPGADSFTYEFEQRLEEAVWSRGYRSILSGVGGDEVTGGVPDGRPELADYLVGGRLVKLFRQSFAWSLVDRSPIIATLYATLRYTIQTYARRGSATATPPRWLTPRSRDLVNDLQLGTNPASPRLPVRPTATDNAQSWWSVMETMPHLFPSLLRRPEYRYPFLDKDLTEYLFSIPREEVLQPGRRRALMRRALVGIVPQEILERRRKAYQLHAPLKTLRAVSPQLLDLFQDSHLAAMGLIDPQLIRTAIAQLANGSADGWQALVRAIALELWLRTNESSKTDSHNEHQGHSAFTGSTA